LPGHVPNFPFCPKTGKTGTPSFPELPEMSQNGKNGKDEQAFERGKLQGLANTGTRDRRDIAGTCPDVPMAGKVASYFLPEFSVSLEKSLPIFCLSFPRLWKIRFLFFA
jgi:hypothetical protein